jgi:hypothetical protein
MMCDDNCLECTLPKCIYDKEPKKKKEKRKPQITITHFVDKADYMRQYNKLYYESHKEEFKAKRLNNREKYNEYRRNSYKRHRPEELERQKKYRMKGALNGSVSTMA